MSIVNDLDLDSIVLGYGSHSSPEDGMCILEAVAFMAGEPFSAAGDAAGAAARERLTPTKQILQASAHSLIERMIGASL